MRILFLAIGLAVVHPAAAPASEMERVPPVSHADTMKECGECHMAFQPGLLPAESWGRLMDGLADHFGEDASLPPAVAASVRAYLTGAAARRGDAQVLRITEQPWWLRKHRRVRPAVWQREDVRAKLNCPACHEGADRGLYDDD